MARFNIFDQPAATTAASVTQAAGGAGVRNVCTAIMLSAAGGAAEPVSWQLRDGASGLGTVLAAGRLNVVGGQAQLNELSIIGSENTAMTLEFDGAGAGLTNELAVSLIGYTYATS